MTLSILLVDDEPSLAEAMADLLRMDGHTVSVAHDGNGALGLARDNDFDLIITDVMMPVISGEQLLARLRAGTTPGQWLALMSAAPRPPGLDHDIHFLAKPIRPQALEHLVGACERAPEIRARRARRGLRIVPRPDSDGE